MIASQLKVEHTKLFGRKLYWIELAILAALIVAILGILAVVAGTGDENGPLAAIKEAGFWPDGLMLAGKLASSSGLGGMLMIVLVGAFVAQEYSWGVLATTLGHGIPRPLVLLAKAAILTLAALVMCTAAVVAAGGASMLLTVMMGKTVSIGGDALATALKLIIGCVLTLLPYIGLTLWLAVSTRSTVAAIGAGIGTMFMEGMLSQIAMLAGGVWAQITGYLPSMLGNSLFAGPQAASEAAAASPLPAVDPTVAVIGLVAYWVVFVGLALWSFQKQDLTA